MLATRQFTDSSLAESTARFRGSTTVEADEAIENMEEQG